MWTIYVLRADSVYAQNKLDSSGSLALPNFDAIRAYSNFTQWQPMVLQQFNHKV